MFVFISIVINRSMAEDKMSFKLETDDAKNLRTLMTALNTIFNEISTKLDDVNNNIIELRENSVKQDNIIEIKESIAALKEDVLTRVNEVKSCADEALIKANENSVEIRKVRESINKLTYGYERVVNENIELKKNVNHLENYSRRNNLVIRDIPEEDGEDCEQLVKTFILNHLSMNDDFVNQLKFVRVHRLGKKPQEHHRYTRAIIMRFNVYSDKQKVWSARSKLAKTKFSLSENFCGMTEYNRKKIYPIFRVAKKNPLYENKVSMVEDTLIIKNIRYTVDNLCDLPADLHPKHFCNKSNDHVHVFGGVLSEYSAFSNWSPARFEYEQHVYVNLEQAYMHIKAKVNGDEDAGRKIMYTTNPRDIKFIGSKIVIDNDRWDAMKGDVMVKLVRAKFSQNEDLMKELLKTGNKTLGETGKDSYFSVGLPLTHGGILDTKSWKAPSKLGKALESVREELRG